MGNRIVVINPNSSTEVTAGIDRALDDFRGGAGDEIDCLTLAEGPPGIETQRHVDGVVMPLPLLGRLLSVERQLELG